MSNRILMITVVRPTRTVTATGGTTSADVPVPGSPFAARVFRVPQTTVQRDEDQSATATVDQMRRLSILSLRAVIQVNDIALIPSDSDSSKTVRAKVIRPRPYTDRVQCDLEVGAE